jgi:hypothetical protein
MARSAKEGAEVARGRFVCHHWWHGDALFAIIY